VTLRDASTGAVIGVPTTLKFKGQNKIVDRRSMVFQASDTKKKKKAEPESAPEPAAEEEEEDYTPAPRDESSAGNEPPPVEGRPGGGCSVGPAGTTRGATLGLMGLLMIAGLASRAARRSRIG